MYIFKKLKNVYKKKTRKAPVNYKEEFIPSIAFISHYFCFVCFKPKKLKAKNVLKPIHQISNENGSFLCGSKQAK